MPSVAVGGWLHDFQILLSHSRDYLAPIPLVDIPTIGSLKSSKIALKKLTPLLRQCSHPFVKSQLGKNLISNGIHALTRTALIKAIDDHSLNTGRQLIQSLVSDALNQATSTALEAHPSNFQAASLAQSVIYDPIGASVADVFLGQ